MTLEEVDRSAFERAADTILSARTIYIVGIRSCAPLASFLAFYFHMIFPDVRQVQTNSSSEIFEQMIRITEDDVVIGISFPRYSMRTMKALEFANSRKAKVITITDSVHSPMNVLCSLYADCQERYGIDRRFSGGPFECNQCACRGALHETPGGCEKDT